ncbi:MAG: TetR/AcrR family transcriptional regulator [Pseudomonadales bacterium]
MAEQAVSEAPQRQAICSAARQLFARYGYERVSLEEVAREANMSRSGIYNYFRNKEDILKSVTNEIHARSHQQAQDAANSDASVYERLRGVFKAKMVLPFSELHGTPHGDSLTGRNMQVTDELVRKWGADFVRLVASVLKSADQAGEINLGGIDLTPDSAASFLVLCSRGLKTSSSAQLTPREYQKRIDQLIRVGVAGFGGAV